ncbi:phosphate-binding protein [Tumebacillus algifaecis]|uniref:Phosphate-binding protein n=1 Tax=Tumebacillus algifaecis TaxID=1214604 RepID=A0A223CX86_9BACL|nr:phosphate ABC transporter substrate-binding protein [Tumebacillus algifaecis]ASS73911.1 phosphate-binding protein [Tumebacillus algifaecis]
MFATVSKKTLSLGLIATMTAGLLVGCGTKEESQPKSGGDSNAPKQEELTGKITASGSSALLPLVKHAAAKFQDKHQGVTVDVAAGGSGTGLKQVAEGAVNIGNSDVEAGDEYKDKGLVDHQVAVAPFVLVTNKDVSVEDISSEQAAKILTGEVTNWKDVGGKDQKITIIGRAESSGSRKYIKSALLPKDKDFAKDAVVQDSTGALKTSVEQTSGSIGYMDAPYADDKIKILKLDGVAYSPENISNGSWKLFSIEHMYTKGTPDKVSQAFLDYIMSADFQNNEVEALKFIPINKIKK